MITIFTRNFGTSGVPRSIFSKFNKYVVSNSSKEFEVVKLIKPVGLIDPPSKSTKYKEGNSLKDMLDPEKTEKRSEELGLEFNRSGMYDMYTFRKTNGKLFEAPQSYWKDNKALYFPHVIGRSLVGRINQNIEDSLKGKISIVKIFTNPVAEKMTDSFTKNEELDVDYANKDFEKLKDWNSQIVEINLIDSKAKEIIFKLFGMSKLRKLVPSFLHKNYFLSLRTQIPFTVREQLMINNMYTGYVMIVDPNLKIRWIACGNATEEDFKTLWKSVRGIKRENETS
ncbi:hypothetical protein Kpol_1055p79 [Vanderwaltozyma polyspora DSM 70294]|uniref:Mitochondrial ATPase complex subunit ATP10 n=1 Tax=Vanderwaltozyma polyspora (strain ATCC 22028 / DSM 70294 / BCRC 21397 / CBS 2163 / NBRC 10782 / NRRL Y-8283 / UCD 57-17) TaxID=436907 RepID=A7TGF2_VANPO|nr:uncharacterized protein Kpol_1055p79 [Vanderwaltozyma polyspora DSM 70294]EDO18722.1 hypothetical protein Kpol_1055p79 [Vanderwaltozyma polyspora DSM 70294]